MINIYKRIPTQALILQSVRCPLVVSNSKRNLFNRALVLKNKLPVL